VGKIPWRRAWQPTPIFLPGESHGRRSLGDSVHGLQRVGHDWSNLTCMPTSRWVWHIVIILNSREIFQYVQFWFPCKCSKTMALLNFKINTQLCFLFYDHPYCPYTRWRYNRACLHFTSACAWLLSCCFKLVVCSCWVEPVWLCHACHVWTSLVMSSSTMFCLSHYISSVASYVVNPSFQIQK